MYKLINDERIHDSQEKIKINTVRPSGKNVIKNLINNLSVKAIFRNKNSTLKLTQFSFGPHLKI
ncbi:hypothetical protein BpHYR1_014337 [Brachionus plicatilis]|uniref:Uncharacterized protein n=1 Tax=Brachionus plicatilis TaxID=10195 RepID=A0A3M7Q6W9_BRAPC|nr:hypothetical protein BpHYR1_014337 [Brachionus plicatilis]